MFLTEDHPPVWIDARGMYVTCLCTPTCLNVSLISTIWLLNKYYIYSFTQTHFSMVWKSKAALNDRIPQWTKNMMCCILLNVNHVYNFVSKMQAVLRYCSGKYFLTFSSNPVYWRQNRWLCKNGFLVQHLSGPTSGKPCVP